VPPGAGNSIHRLPRASHCAIGVVCGDSACSPVASETLATLDALESWRAFSSLTDARKRWSHEDLHGPLPSSGRILSWQLRVPD
jgi:hypothetical protein